MDITASFLAFTLLGATWVLWLLLALEDEAPSADAVNAALSGAKSRERQRFERNRLVRARMGQVEWMAHMALERLKAPAGEDRLDIETL